MKTFLKCFFLLFLVTLSFLSYGQIKDFGIPSIVNHSRSSYNASTQNWSITQSSKGFIYFGNNDGVLEYDGTNWTTFPLPNQSIIRSVLAIGDTIFAGAFEEIGFIAPDHDGKLKFHSLNHLVPRDFKAFDEIWNIFSQQGKIIFQSFNYIFILENNNIEVIEPLSQFGLLHFANERFYVVDTENGLMQLKDDSLQLISNHPVFFRNEIRSILPFENDKLLIGTSNEGLFIFDGSRLSPWDSEINEYLKLNNLFSAIELSDGNFAFGSIRNGLFISNRQGNVLQHLNRYKGLQNNTILFLYEDSRKNLWLGLDNGIDYIETSSPLSSLNYNYNIESAYASIVHNGILYVGTNQGLYAAEFSKIRSSGLADEKFRIIKGTEGQVWTLEVIDNTLFCGHNFGCFQIDGFSARQISDLRGFWSFLKPPQLDNIIIAGTYTGLVRLKKMDGRWEFLDEVKGFKESSRKIFLDLRNKLWVAHGYRGIFQLQLSDSLNEVTRAQLFVSRAGLPPELPYNINVVKNEMIISTEDGLYQFDHSSDTFYKPDELNRIFDGKGFIDKIHQDKNGNLWYYTNQYLGVMRLLEDGTLRDITAPFSRINENLLPAFENIYVHDANNVFIGSQMGLTHYDPSIIKDYSLVEEVFINEASFYGKHETMPFFFRNALSAEKIKETENIPYSNNSVTFRFTIPAFENPNKTLFSYRLKGFDDNWSAWDGINFKEYTNLREGNYTFEVKAINAFGAESQVKTIAFSIEPPLFRSRPAYILYSVIILLIIASNFYIVRRRILRIRQREKFRHEKRLAQREQIFNEKTAMSENEIIQLRNERLQSEMKHKNKELANTTLHLIQKNRTLTSIKAELNKIQKNSTKDRPDSHFVNNLIKKINKDLRNEKNWEVFNNYFDEVHQEFLKRVKEKHPNLSPKDLRLCAYLKMNISTKEIAPLMNISIRGVEISRYRLRKKMNLDHDTNLIEYILTL